jgi:hypothetical protein
VTEPPLPGEGPPAGAERRPRRERERERERDEPRRPRPPTETRPPDLRDDPPTAATSVARPEIDGGTQLSFDEQD